MLLPILDTLFFIPFVLLYLGTKQESSKSGRGVEIRRRIALCPVPPREKEISRRKGNQHCQIRKSEEEKGGENSQGF